MATYDRKRLDNLRWIHRRMKQEGVTEESSLEEMQEAYRRNRKLVDRQWADIRRSK